jgi:DNA-binding NarL/FixJ family response regulator
MIRLKTRQRDVLLLLSKGLTNKEIARQVGIGKRNVKACVSGLLLIFDASNRTELAGMSGLSEVENDTITSNSTPPV